MVSSNKCSGSLLGTNFTFLSHLFYDIWPEYLKVIMYEVSSHRCLNRVTIVHNINYMFHWQLTPKTLCLHFELYIYCFYSYPIIYLINFQCIDKLRHSHFWEKDRNITLQCSKCTFFLSTVLWNPDLLHSSIYMTGMRGHLFNCHFFFFY